jgi:hypothetical protein
MSKSKFDAPNPSKDVDTGKFLKLAQRVEQVLTTECLYPEPKQIDPDKVLVSPLNRLGASPNTKHVHFGILRSFLKNSFDRTRPAIGICVEIKSEQGLKRLLEHNHKFSQGNRLLPPILQQGLSGPVYASLACTHLNLAFRCIKNGTSSPVCDVRDLMEHGTLKEVAQNGHRWWVLPESLAQEKQTDISLWRNQDQNENQAVHELEILQTIKHAAEGFLAKGTGHVSLGDLVSASQKRNPAKISPVSWMTLAKLYTGFLENGVADLVDDLMEYHSEHVDPRELTVSLKFFSAVSGEEAFKSCPQIRHYLITSQYTSEKVTASSSGPSVSQFLEITQIASFAKKRDQVNQLETTIRDLKAKYLPLLSASLGPRVARLEITEYMDLILRSLFGKPWPEKMEPKVTLPVGKFSEEKVKALGIHWAKVVDLKHKSCGFAAAAGLQPLEEEQEGNSVFVDLENLRALKRDPSGGPDPQGPQFKRGDAVTVIRRMSWTLPRKSNPNFRKDVTEGTQGVIEGWADTEMRQVLLSVDLNISGKQQTITQAVYARNLKLTSDYLLTKAGEAASSSSCDNQALQESEPAVQDNKKPQWLLGSSSPADVRVERKWSSLQADADMLTKTMYLRGRIATGLQALSEVLPKFTEKDFVVLNRKNDKGLWKSEIFTNRDFEPLEIMLAPFSSQIKETHLMAAAHAVVTLPKNGPGAHPENLCLAMDGRCRNMIASKDSVDPEEHTGSLYWIVTRTSDPQEVNLELEIFTWEQQIKVNLPGSKKRKVDPVQWLPSQCPSFPVLINKKAIQKHTKLCMFLAPKSEAKGKK